MMVYNCAKFQNHRAFRKRFTEGGAESAPPPAVLGFKKPGLFRVNRLKFQGFAVEFFTVLLIFSKFSSIMIIFIFYKLSPGD